MGLGIHELARQIEGLKGTIEHFFADVRATGALQPQTVANALDTLNSIGTSAKSLTGFLTKAASVSKLVLAAGGALAAVDIFSTIVLACYNKKDDQLNQLISNLHFANIIAAQDLRQQATQTLLLARSQGIVLSPAANALIDQGIEDAQQILVILPRFTAEISSRVSEYISNIISVLHIPESSKWEHKLLALNIGLVSYEKLADFQNILKNVTQHNYDATQLPRHELSVELIMKLYGDDSPAEKNELRIELAKLVNEFYSSDELKALFRYAVSGVDRGSEQFASLLFYVYYRYRQPQPVSRDNYYEYAEKIFRGVLEKLTGIKEKIILIDSIAQDRLGLLGETWTTDDIAELLLMYVILAAAYYTGVWFKGMRYIGTELYIGATVTSSPARIIYGVSHPVDSLKALGNGVLFVGGSIFNVGEGLTNIVLGRTTASVGSTVGTALSAVGDVVSSISKILYHHPVLTVTSIAIGVGTELIIIPYLHLATLADLKHNFLSHLAEFKCNIITQLVELKGVIVAETMFVLEKLNAIFHSLNSMDSQISSIVTIATQTIRSIAKGSPTTEMITCVTLTTVANFTGAIQQSISPSDRHQVTKKFSYTIDDIRNFYEEFSSSGINSLGEVRTKFNHFYATYMVKSEGVPAQPLGHLLPQL